MRPRVPHMNELDNAILEFLAEMGTPGGEPVAMAPTAMWVNLAVIREMTTKKQNTFSNRMNQLSTIGLLEKIDEQRGYYKITDKGLAYLDGDLDAEELQLPDDE